MRAALLLLSVLVAAPTLAAREDRSLGAGVTLSAATPLADVIAKPADFVGQTIRVEGVVTAVCEHMGCWMTLVPPGATGEKPATLRLKVDDGVIVFPITAKGRAAIAQGVIEVIGGDDHHGAGGGYHLKVSGALLR